MSYSVDSESHIVELAVSLIYSTDKRLDRKDATVLSEFTDIFCIGFGSIEKTVPKNGIEEEDRNRESSPVIILRAEMSCNEIKKLSSVLTQISQFINDFNPAQPFELKVDDQVIITREIPKETAAANTHIATRNNERLIEQ